MSQKTSVFNLEQLMDYLGSETFVGVTSAGYEPYKDQSGELRDTERFLLLDDKGFVSGALGSPVTVTIEKIPGSDQQRKITIEGVPHGNLSL